MKAARDLAEVALSGATREVNSYHDWALDSGAAQPFPALWVDETNGVEGVVAEDARVAGVMWHPEREPAFDAADRRLLRWLFLRAS